MAVATTGSRVARGADSALDAVVGALAAWTVVFHLARLFDMPRDAALVLWLVVLVLGAVLVRSGRPGFPSVPPAGSSGGIGPVAIVAALVVAAGLAWLDIDGLWWPPAWLVVLAVPSNDFRQELGTAQEVKEFCALNFALDLPMTDITQVRGPDAHPFYVAVAAETGFVPSWNFNKILIGPDGTVVDTWRAAVEPDSPAIRDRVEALLD